MRKQLLVVLLPLLVLSAIGETPSADTTKHATLQKVDVVRGNDGISVEITSRGQITPTVSTLESPTRVVVSLPNTVAATTQNHLSVDSNGVKGVRIGTDGHTPPTTSVVIDLLTACTYELAPASDGKVIVKLHAAGSSAKTAKPAATPHIAPASMHRTALTPAAAPAPVPVSAVPATVPALDQKPAQSASAQDFVFVEPSYQAKPASQGSESAVAAPPARVVEAAAKFVDKPEGSLLPAPSAAMQQTSQAANTTTMQPAVNLAAEQKVQASQVVSAPEPKYTGEPISVNLKDVDLKDFFRLIHEISGLNVVLDPNVKGSLTIVLDDVPWDQALDIVLKNNDLARQLDGNVLRIATVDTLRHEAEARRAQHDAEALAVDKITFTRFLSYAHAKDLDQAIDLRYHGRNILDHQGIGPRIGDDVATG